MKKLTFLVALFMLFNVAFAGGLLTNTNQSAQFIRMMSRNASLDIDAVYFNPAGLIKMEDGWHFAFYSQTIFQDKTVESKFPLLNDGSYLGKVTVPVFPTAFAVYKSKDWAFSFGFGPNAGGGSADFERGLPSFEIPITKVVPGLAPLAGLSAAGVNLDLPGGYDADLSFSGSSIFWGIQLGATYKINDVFSVFGGVRYMPSKNTYQGSIKNIQLDFAGQKSNAMQWMKDQVGVINDKSSYYTGAAAQASAAATQFSGAATSLQPVIDGGGSSYTLTELEGAGFISASQKAQLEGGLQLIGLTSEQINAMNAATVQGAYSSASATLSGQAQQASGAVVILDESASGLDELSDQMGNKEVDTEQTGAGFTPMIGINISPNDEWNIGIKYEHKTYMTLTNSTKVDDLNLFPDGGHVNSDVPGILGIGVGYKGNDWLEAQLSYNMYFNKGVDWGNNVRTNSHREIDNNGYEIGLGLQFNLSDNFAFSVGGLYGDMGIADSYQSDFSYSNASFTPGAGIMWKITDQLTLDAGVSNTYYIDSEVTYTDPDVGSYKETFGKTALTFAAGLSYSIF